MELVSSGLIAAALVARALDHAADGALDEGMGVLRRLVGLLRQQLSETGSEDGLLALERLAEAPDSAKNIERLAALIEERATSDAEFRGELGELVEQVRAAGVDVDSISQLAVGDGNVQIADVSDSSIKVTGAGSPDEGRASRSAG